MKFSIITPTLGASHWLQMCVQSVRDQAGQGQGQEIEVEHIVLNGLPAQAGAVDQACRGATTATDQGYTIKVIHEADGGMYEAINKGFRLATGELIAWLNSDEQYLPTTLADVAAFMRTSTRFDLCVGDTVLVDDLLKPIGYRQAVIPDFRFVQAAYLNLHSSSMFLRRSWYERGFVLPTHWKTISDAAWLVAMLQAGLQIGIIHRPLSCFTFTGKNLGQSEQAMREVRLWHVQSGQNRLERTGHQLRHLVKECLAGARFRRNVRVAVYTKEGSAFRSEVFARNVSPRFRQSPQG